MFSARVPQLAGAKEAVPWVPRLLTCGSGGGIKGALPLLCLPSQRVRSAGFLYGFEARILTQVAFGTNGPCGNVIIQRARASAPRNIMDYVSECPSAYNLWRRTAQEYKKKGYIVAATHATPRLTF